MTHPPPKNQDKLKIGLIVDSQTSTKYVYELAEWGQRQSDLEITHLLIQETESARKGKFDEAVSMLKRHGFLYLFRQKTFSAIKKMETLAIKSNKTYKHHVSRYNLSDCVKKHISIKPAISKSGFVYRYGGDDIREIKKLKLDILIRCGSGILRGEILNCTRLGIISFHHADNRINRGGPPGFWEVFLKQDSTGFTIQQLTEELDGGNVLCQGHLTTKYYFMLNQAALYEKSNYYLKKLLTDIAATKELPPKLSSFPYYNQLYKSPGLRVQLKYSAYLALTLIDKVFNDFLFKKKYSWGVAFSPGDWKNLLDPNGPQRAGEAIVEPFHMSSPQPDIRGFNEGKEWRDFI